MLQVYNKINKISLAFTLCPNPLALHLYQYFLEF